MCRFVDCVGVFFFVFKFVCLIIVLATHDVYVVKWLGWISMNVYRDWIYEMYMMQKFIIKWKAF